MNFFYAQRANGKKLAYVLAVILLVCITWHVIVTALAVPSFIFPPPLQVFETLIDQRSLLLEHTLFTSAEIIAGLLIGSLLGVASAVFLSSFKRARTWALPLMVISQSLPVFAIAPLLTLWFGYGISSKIIMATLIIYFPVVAATFDGLRYTNTAMLEQARTMNASSIALLRHIRIPAAFPSMASGIRVATSVAPIGAIVGEWVGSSKGLGYLMLHANGRMQTDLMFAALLCLSLIAICLYTLVNALLDRALYWQADTQTF